MASKKPQGESRTFRRRLDRLQRQVLLVDQPTDLGTRKPVSERRARELSARAKQSRRADAVLFVIVASVAGALALAGWLM